MPENGSTNVLAAFNSPMLEGVLGMQMPYCKSTSVGRVSPILVLSHLSPSHPMTWSITEYICMCLFTLMIRSFNYVH